MERTPVYWQIAAGDAGRDYSGEFLRYGLGFLGGESQTKLMREVMPGDRMVLKRGKGWVVAAGIVVQRDGRHFGENDKEWLRDFDGWDLPAYCFVQWHVPPQPIPAPDGFAISTISRVKVAEIRTIADEIIARDPMQTVELEPVLGAPVQDEDLIEALIVRGLAIGAAEGLSDALRRIRRLVNYYYHNENWRDVREHETRTFLVVPLLLALGWPEQCIKIELHVTGGRMDLALYDKPYFHADAKCQVIIETKGFSDGLHYASGQARDYAAHFPDCHTILVSNGFCYKAYKRGPEGFQVAHPDAYLNLRDPRDRYPLYPAAGGALHVLYMLLRGGQ